jgi:hypothetical protein
MIKKHTPFLNKIFSSPDKHNIKARETKKFYVIPLALAWGRFCFFLFFPYQIKQTATISLKYHKPTNHVWSLKDVLILKKEAIEKDYCYVHTWLVGLWYFNDIVAVSFIGKGNRRKLLTCRKSVANVIT